MLNKKLTKKNIGTKKWKSKKRKRVLRGGEGEDDIKKKEAIMTGIFTIISSPDYEKLEPEKKIDITQINNIYNEGLQNITMENLNNLYEKLINDVFSPFYSEEKKQSNTDEEERTRVEGITKNVPFKNPLFVSELSKSHNQPKRLSNLKHLTMPEKLFPENVVSFNWINIVGDGACLFNAVVQFIFGVFSKDISQKLRNHVVDIVFEKQKDGMTNTEKNTYVTNMKQYGTYGGDREIAGLRELLNKKNYKNEKKKLSNFLKKVKVNPLERFNPEFKTLIYIIAPVLPNGNLDLYGEKDILYKLNQKNTNKIYIFYNGYDHYDLLVPNLKKEASSTNSTKEKKHPKKPEEHIDGTMVCPTD